jgi:hypothetical protein
MLQNGLAMKMLLVLALMRMAFLLKSRRNPDSSHLFVKTTEHYGMLIALYIVWR